MPINPELLAQGQHTQGGNIGANIVGGTRAKLNQTRNALLDVQLNEYQSPDQAGARKDAAELQSIISGVTVAYPLLAGGNVEAALGSLRARSQALRESGRNPQHTDELIANIEEGNIEETLQVMRQYLGAGQGEQAETFVPATPEDLAGRPEGTVAQKSATTGKLINIFTPDSVDDKEQNFTEDANGRKRYEGGEKHGQFLFPDLVQTPDKSKNAESEEGLRKEFNNLVKDFNLVSDSFERVKASVSDPSGAGDLALIFNYMKMLDPNSVVRESEFATAQNTGNVPNRVIGLYNRLLSEEGMRLSIDQRNDFVTRANKLLDAARGQAGKTAEAYTNIAERNGVDARNVIENFTVRSDQEPAATLTEGTVIRTKDGTLQKVVNGKLVNVNG